MAEAATAKTDSAPSRRRSGNTRANILEVAQRRLERAGPDGLRLQDIARDSGVSHPTILHHFGSRDGLMVALVEHIGKNFVEEVVRRAPWQDVKAQHDMAKVNLAFAVFADKGFGQLIGWAVRQRPGDIKRLASNLFDGAIADFIAAKTRRDGVPPADDWVKEARHVTRLAIIAAVGEGAVGALLPVDSSKAFRVWLSDLLEERVGV